MRAVGIVVAFALLISSSDAAKKKADADGSDRMRMELDASGAASEEPPPQTEEMRLREAAAKEGLDYEYRDALKDIMAVLLHGSDASKDSALERLINLAVSSGEAGREQARRLRSAVVAGGALPAVVETLGATEPRRQYLAAASLHALALDDPTTDADNFHQNEICQAGAVTPLVKLLESDEPQVQSAATGALASLAENPTCQAMIAAQGAISPLLSMAHYGSDMQKLGALGALDVLSVNNARVKQQLTQEGAGNVLSGLATMGSNLLREEARDFGARLAEAEAAPMSADAHVKAARQTRMRYDGVRQRAFQRMQGWGQQPQE